MMRRLLARLRNGKGKPVAATGPHSSSRVFHVERILWAGLEAGALDARLADGWIVNHFLRVDARGVYVLFVHQSTLQQQAPQVVRAASVPKFN